MRRRNTPGAPRALLAVALIALAGCAVGPDYTPPEETVPDLWRMQLTRGLGEGKASFQQWWTALDDAMLTGLIQRAGEGSLDVRLALERIDEAAEVTPGFSSPTIQPMQDPGWLGVKVMVEKERVHGVIDRLEAIGCVAILETELRHARL